MTDVKWNGEWYSWDNTSGDATKYQSWKRLVQDENYDYLSVYKGRFDIYEAGCLIEVDDFIPSISEYREFCTLKPGSPSEREQVEEYGAKPGSLQDCSFYLEEGDLDDIDRKFYGVPIWMGLPADAEVILPNIPDRSDKCASAARDLQQH